MEALWRDVEGLPLFAVTDQFASAKWLEDFRGGLTVGLVQNDLAKNPESQRSVELVTSLEPLAVSTFGRDAMAIHDLCDDALYKTGQLEVVTLAFEMEQLNIPEIIFNTVVLMSPYQERTYKWRGRMVVFGNDIDRQLVEAIHSGFMNFRV